MRMPSRRTGLRLAALGVAFASVMAIGLWLVAHGDERLRRMARLTIENQLSSLLQGEILIDRVDSLSLGSIVVTGVVVRDPQKRVVVRGKRLEIDFDLSALWNGKIRLTRARLSGVQARLYPATTLPISLFEALTPKPTTDPSTGTGPSVHFESVSIEHADLAGDVPGLAGIKMHDVTLRARIDVTDAFHVRVFSVRGLCEAPFEVPLQLSAGTLSLTAEPLTIDGSFRVDHEQEHLRIALGYVGATDALSLRLALEPLSTDTLHALKLGAPSTLLGDLTGTVKVASLGDAWTFRAALQSAGGPLSIVGDRTPAGETTVHVATPGIDLSQLFAYTPPILLGVRVDAVAAPDGTVRIDATSPAIEALGFTLAQVGASGTYHNGRLTLAQTGFHYAGGRFDVSGYIDDDADLTLRVRSLIPDVTRDRALRKQGLHARVSTDVTVTQLDGELAVEGRVAMQGFVYEGVSADVLNLQGRASGSFETPDVHVTAQGKGVAIGGYPIGEATITANGAHGIYHTDLSVKDALGRAASAKVRFEDRERSLRIVAKPLTLSVPGREPWRAEADIVLDSDGVELRRVVLENGAQHLDAAGRFSSSRAYRIEAKLVRFDLGGLRELLAMDLADLDGTVDGTLALTGVPGHPRIDARATLEAGQFLGMQGLNAMINMVFVEGRFDAQGEIVLPDRSRLALVLGGTPGRGKAWVDQIASGNYQFGLDFENVPFAVSRPWLLWLGLTPPGGTISAMIRGEGALTAPTIEVTTRVDDLVLDDWPALDIELSLVHDARTLTVRKLSVGDARGELGHAEGSVEARLDELFDPGTLRSSLDKRPFQLAITWPQRRLDQLPASLQVAWPVTTSGTLEVHQSEGGPAVTLSARGGVAQGAAAFDACGIQRSLQGTLAAHAHGQEASAAFSGTLDEQPLAQATARADLPVTDWITGRIAPSLPRASGELRASTDAAEDIPFLCRLMVGPLTLKAQARDLFADPPEVSFELSSPALQLIPNKSQRQLLGGLKTAQAAGRPFGVDLRGAVEKDLVSFIGHLDAGSGSTLDIFGAVPRAALRPRPAGRDVAPLEARIRVKNMELSRLLVALPISIRAGARLNGEARVAYDLDDDRLGLEGALAITEGKLAIPTLGQELSDLRGNLKLSGNRITIENFSAHDFDGRVQVSGELRFDTLHHALTQLTFTLRDFPVRREGAQVSKVTGKLTLRADLDSERARAELVVGDLRIDLPNDLGQELQDLDPHPDILVVGEERPAAPEAPYIYELHVVAKNPPFRVRRTDLSAEVRADLNVRYREPLLTIQGSAELKRGSFELYGKRFDLEESRLAFDGEDQLDPLVSLVATHKIGSDEITVRLEGRLSAPKVTFSHSDPTVTDTGEIIGQLLGGRSSDTAQTSQDATGAAASFLAGATAGLLTEEVRREFGGAIPVLALESGDQAFRNARIRAGVQLDRLIEKRLGPLRKVVRGAYVEGFVAPGADPESATQSMAPQSRGGGLLELRFPADFLGTIEYRPVQNWRLDVAWEP